MVTKGRTALNCIVATALWSTRFGQDPCSLLFHMLYLGSWKIWNALVAVSSFMELAFWKERHTGKNGSYYHNQRQMTTTCGRGHLQCLLHMKLSSKRFTWAGCGNKWRPPKWEEAIFPKLALARESVTIPALGRDSDAGRGVEMLYRPKRAASGGPWVEAVVIGEQEAVGHPMWPVKGAYLTFSSCS